MNEQYLSLANYIKIYDFEMCLNCLFVVSNADSNFEIFLKRLLKQDTLKEMNLPYLESYLQSKMGAAQKESFQPADRSKWKTTTDHK